LPFAFTRAMPTSDTFPVPPGALVQHSPKRKSAKQVSEFPVVVAALNSQPMQQIQQVQLPSESPSQQEPQQQKQHQQNPNPRAVTNMRPRQSRVAAYTRPREARVLAAVESLYQDELRPYGRILRKRLTEWAAEEVRGPVMDVDASRLRVICEASSSCTVQDEEGGEWSVLLKSRRENFVDIYSPIDVYPPELWAAAAAYFGGPECASMTLPGGRYACARVLLSRGLSFLNGFSLGQVCHLVQLAISHVKILGYLNGVIVPYGRSQSMFKDRCAECQCAWPAANGDGTTVTQGSADAASSLPVASWDALRRGLREILESAQSAGPDPVALSNLKRLFRSDYNLELSETALGHAKLSELLQDVRLSDICTLELRGVGYVVIPTERPLKASTPPDASTTMVLQASATPAVLLATQPSTMQPPWAAEVPMGMPSWTVMPFWYVDSPPRSSEQLRSGEFLSPIPAPVHTDVPLYVSEASNQQCVVSQEGVDASETADDQFPSVLSTLGQEGPVGRCPEWTSVRSTFIHATLPPSTPPVDGKRRRSQSVPKESGASRDLWGMTLHALSFEPRSIEVEATSYVSHPVVTTPSPIPRSWGCTVAAQATSLDTGSGDLSFAELLQRRLEDDNEVTPPCTHFCPARELLSLDAEEDICEENPPFGAEATPSPQSLCSRWMSVAPPNVNSQPMASTALVPTGACVVHIANFI